MIQANTWEDFLDIVRQEEGSRVVETWFKAVLLSSWDPFEKKVALQAPNAFVRNWLVSNYIGLIQKHLSRLLNVTELKVQILIGSESSDAAAKSKALVVSPLPVAPRGAQVPMTAQRRSYSLNQHYRFDTFVVGPNNSLAYAAAKAVAEKEGGVYNPFFIYGGSGLGKTHLLHAIGNAIKERYPTAGVLYQTADRFVSEFISAIRFDKVHKFKAKYRNVDVLLVDDIQFISNKDQTQEAFFHIFNSLYESDKQIVFSSDTFPQDLSGIAERLRSRMAWGLVADIHMPPLETKIAILKRKAHANNEVLADDVAHFIADTVVSNIRELEGALIRVIAFAALTKQPITLELAHKVLLRPSDDRSQPIDFEKIVTSLRRHYAYTLEDLRSKKRNKDIAQVRHLAIYLMKKYTHKSLRDIGFFLGGRNHSTVMHAYQKVQKALAHDEQLMKKMRLIEQELQR